MTIASRAQLRTAIAVGLALATVGCWNGNDALTNEGIIGGSARLQMVVDDERTAYYLVDTATGDLWRLHADGARGQWERVADGPADIRKLSLAELIGKKTTDD